ncbi:hypothetical protein [uncultured Tenacibaculum sp.]|uniref:hypothetical protein n=1 Tax=uncultured Tenacibaculum sp. TaxID=174713 RepID=UPI0026263F83|nr:hypothetical protein [uncultured Tenacibaculum sp.]
MIMRILITLLLFTSLTNNNEFSKHTLPYSIVTSKADLIVEGQIDEINNEKYQFKISDFIKGKDDDTIIVNKWKQWMCDTRPLKYKTGQKLILFLKKVKGKYKVINGSTGELIINDNDGIVRYKYNALPNRLVVKEGIKMLIKSIKYKGKIYSNGKFKFLVSQSEYEKYRNKNAFYYKVTRGLKYD